MFTKEQINEFLESNKGSDNDKGEDWFESNSLKVRLVEAKMLVDRWNVVSTDIIFHSSHKDYVREKLELQPDMSKISEAISVLRENLSSVGEDVFERLQGLTNRKVDDSIWGANIHYSDDVPVDSGIILSINSYTNDLSTGDSRSVAVFPVK